MNEDRYLKAVEQLCELLNLSDDAIAVAEAWSVLPEGIQRHIKALLDEHIANLHPALKDLYANARHSDQIRFNRIVERIQKEKRGN